MGSHPPLDESHSPSKEELARAFVSSRALALGIIKEVASRIVGQEEVIKCAVAGLLLGGHVLVEGVPGLGKTLLARTIASSVALRFNRIQFTPDLMPSDILGTHVVQVGQDGQPLLAFEKGPIFANVVLADEINRASPKTQSALLEAMQERQVSIGNQSHPLPTPFFVIATQNPIDNEGTYPLPEAQLDRFLMKLIVPFPSEDELLEIVLRTAGGGEQAVQVVAEGSEVLRAGELIRSLAITDVLLRQVVRLVIATHPEHPTAPPLVKRYVRVGASPRAAQSILALAKYFALLDGRFHVATEDIRRALLPCLRHRILLNFDAIADGLSVDKVIEELATSFVEKTRSR
ncbi:MAG: AAA family ATPase [Deltaproteobacteria bacterium]|nr:AAA family ATPase [Sandaracinaceae bacterium]MCX7807539.1 AAA family ATPase [Deltaproteobacteria bacterium]MDW8246561.1 MoxR family ATPase [Sandaracinaceae bacterium]